MSMKLKVLFLAVLVSTTTLSFAQLSAGIDKTRMDLMEKPGTDFLSLLMGGG